MLLSEGIPLFLSSRKEQLFAEGTLKSNCQILWKIYDITGDMELTEFTVLVMDEVFRVEAERNLSVSTLNSIQSTMGAFGKWCRTRGYMHMDQDPCAGRRYRKRPEKLMPQLALARFPALLDAAGSWHFRDRAFVALCMYTLCRASEITALRVGDVHLDQRHIDMVIKKTKEVDRMPISKELDRELRRYFEAWQENIGGPLQPDWFLFPTGRVATCVKKDDSRPRSEYYQLVPSRSMTNPQAIVQRALAEIGWDASGWTGIHVVRRSSARGVYDELTAKGYDGAMRRVQTFLHHKSVTMTEHYLGLTLDRETRDAETAGLPMFPSLDDANVVELKSYRQEEEGEAAHGGPYSPHNGRKEGSR